MSKRLQMQRSPVPVYQKDTDYKGIIANVTATDYVQVAGEKAFKRFPIAMVHQPTAQANLLLFPLWKYMERQKQEQIPALELSLKNGQRVIVERPKRMPAYVAPRKSVCFRTVAKAA